MKRFLFLFLSFFALMPLLGQEPEVPGDWVDLYENYGAFFATYLGIAGVASFLAEYVIRLFKVTVQTWKVVIVVGLAIGLSFLGNVLNLGYLAEAEIYETILWGALSAATAAGLRSSNLIFFKTVVDFIVSYLKAKEPAE